MQIMHDTELASGSHRAHGRGVSADRLEEEPNFFLIVNQLYVRARDSVKRFHEGTMISTGSPDRGAP